MTLCIGIDPGLHGAIAILDQAGELVSVTDLPVIRDLSLAWIDGSALRIIVLTRCPGAHAAQSSSECQACRVRASPRHSSLASVSVRSSASCKRCTHPLEFVTPAVRKRLDGLGKDKHASLHKARLMYPTAELHLAKHDGRAESLLLARYALARRAAA